MIRKRNQNLSKQPKLTPYELERQKNIEEKLKYLASLNVQIIKDDYLNCEGVARLNRDTKLPKKKRLKKQFNVVRQSQRLKNQDITESLNHLEIKFLCAEPDSILKNLQNISSKTFQYQDCEKEVQGMMKCIANLDMEDGCVQKVVAAQITSLSWSHPSLVEPIIMVGDKYGNFGRWIIKTSKNGEIKGGGQDVKYYNIFKDSAIEQISVPKGSPDLVYALSRDGVIARCHSNLGFDQFTKVHIPAPKKAIITAAFDMVDERGNEILMGTHTGNVLAIDIRNNNKSYERVYKCHNKPINTLQVHPLNPHHFITATAGSTVSIWDRRMMCSSRPQSMVKIKHGSGAGGVSSAFFNPLTASKVLTVCSDDTVNVFEVGMDGGKRVGKSDQICEIGHDNRVGQWLTNFKAVWHPVHESFFVVGSMNTPRQIQIYSCAGDLVARLTSKYLDSITSLNVFHPTLNALAGANSAGKVFLFSHLSEHLS